eukprot:CAMPEP_0115392044 /NCGR_PEP_ID=MMETSP0271-20121206/11021_1 /TAXON_ID=71861 /ORGANISM="Scrippsiella trochoidea, Strain CCMP3099" /LENGTH=93 /DNA_ID=CAMNT_0002815619 /DNA_START=572 /DNA_END=853 /DNA_ORIENTATION=-
MTLVRVVVRHNPERAATQEALACISPTDHADEPGAAQLVAKRLALLFRAEMVPQHICGIPHTLARHFRVRAQRHRDAAAPAIATSLACRDPVD